MNPMIQKELRQLMRERRGWVLPSLYLVALGAVAIFVYFQTLQMQVNAVRFLDGPRYLRSRRSRITLVKDEIDDLKHRAQSLRQFLRRRHLVRNRCLSNLCLGAHNALRQRTRGGEEGLCYLFGCQPAHLTQGERNAGFRCQRWMTTRKYQAQPVIFKAIILKAVLCIGGPCRRTPLRLEIAHELVLRRIKSRPSTQSVNGFESGRRNQPWSRVAGYSTPRPQA